MQEKGNRASLLAGFNWKRKGYQRVFKFTGAQQCFKSKFKDLASNKNIFLSRIFNWAAPVLLLPVSCFHRIILRGAAVR